MGSGNWFKTITSSKKGKGSSRKLKKGSLTRVKSNGVWKPSTNKSSSVFANVTCDGDGNRWVLGRPIEEVAATKIQTTYRAYWARKSLRRLKGIVRLQLLTQGDSVKRQSVSTMNHLHTWGKIQDQIQARRLFMVVEGRLRQKKLENQLKLDTKLHDVEVEWSCTAESMNEIVAKIHNKEEATVKRERAMAYAFTHQWRANASLNQLMGSSEHGKYNWGWSWMERWIAARPWETRLSTTTATLKTRQATPTGKPEKNKTSLPSTPAKSYSPKPTLSSKKGSTPKTTLSNGQGSASKTTPSNGQGSTPKTTLSNGQGNTPKTTLSNGQGSSPKTILSEGKRSTPKTTLSNSRGVTKPRRLSYPPSLKPAPKKNIPVETANTKNEHESKEITK